LKQALRRHAAGFGEMIEAQAIVAKPHVIGNPNRRQFAGAEQGRPR
jgi:hypothetical protein